MGMESDAMIAAARLCPHCKKDLANTRYSKDLGAAIGQPADAPLPDASRVWQEDSIIICGNCYGPREDRALIWTGERLRDPTAAEWPENMLLMLAAGYGGVGLQVKDDA